MSADRMIHYALSGGIGLVSGVIGTLAAVQVSLADLHGTDTRILAEIERIDTHGPRDAALRMAVNEAAVMQLKETMVEMTQQMAELTRATATAANDVGWIRRQLEAR